MGLVRRVTTNAGIILIGTVLQRAVQLLIVVYLARHVSVEQFGQYNLALAILFIATFFLDMGIGPASVREIARQRDRAEHLFSHILALRIALSGVLYLGLLGYTLLSGYPENTRMLISLVGLSLMPNAVTGACETLNIAFENMKQSVSVRFIGMVIAAAGSVSAMYAGFGLRGFIIANLIAEAGLAIFWAWNVRRKYFKYRLSFDIAEWRRIVGHATPFALMLFLQQLNRSLNILLLSKIPGPIPTQTALGYYSSATQVARVATPLLVSVRQAIIPSLAAGKHDEETHAKLLQWTTKLILTLVSVPLILGGVFFAEDVLTLMFGEAYKSAAPAFSILCTAFAFEAGMIGLNGFLSASRDITRFIKYAAISVLINVAICAVLIPKYGVNGAAIGVLVSKIYEKTCSILLCKSIFGRRVFMLRHYIDVAVMAACLAAGVYLVRKFIPGFFLDAAICLVMYLLAGGMLAFQLRQKIRSVRQQGGPAATPA